MGPKQGPGLRFATLSFLIQLNNYAGTEVGLDAETVGRSLIDNYLTPAGLVADYQNEGLGFLTVSWQGSQKRFLWKSGLWVA